MVKAKLVKQTKTVKPTLKVRTVKDDKKPRVVRRTEAERKEFEKILTTKERAAAPTKEEREEAKREAAEEIKKREFEKALEEQAERAREIDIALGRLEPTKGPVAVMPTGEPIAYTPTPIIVKGGPAIPKAISEMETDVVKEKFLETQRRVSEKIPTYEEMVARQEKEKAITAREEAIRRRLITEPVGKVPVADTTAARLYEKTYRYVQEKPLEAVGQVAALYVGGAAVGAAAKIGLTATRAGLLRGAAKVGEETVVGRGLVGATRMVEPVAAIGGLVPAGVEIYKAPTPEEKIETVAKLAVMGLGAARGWKAGEAVVGRIQTRGREFVPLETITEPAVATGEVAFPLTRVGQRPAQLVAEFEAQKLRLPGEIPTPEAVRVWHAAPAKFEPITTVKGKVIRPTDVPGLYVSPKVSPYFTRIPRGEQVKYSLFGEPSPISPTVLRVELKSVGRLPMEARMDIPKAREFLRTRAEPGEAFITPSVEAKAVMGAVEAEAVVTPGTMLGKVGRGKYYTEISGRRVPIEEFKAVGKIKEIPEKVDLKAPKKPVTYEKLIAETEYYRPTKRGIIKPSIYKPTLRLYDTAYKPPTALPTYRPAIQEIRYPIVPTYRPPAYEPYAPVAPRYTPVIPEYRPPTYKPYVPVTPEYRPPTRPPYEPIYIPPVEPTRPPITAYPPVLPMPIAKLRKDKAKLRKIPKHVPKKFEKMFENPIASPFGNSVGRMK